MKIKKGFVLREAAGSYIVMNIGGNMDFNGMITLNETGALIWRSVEEGNDAEAIAEKIAGLYEIDRETALCDVNAFIEKMNGAGILE